MPTVRRLPTACHLCLTARGGGDHVPTCLSCSGLSTNPGRPPRTLSQPCEHRAGGGRQVLATWAGLRAGGAFHTHVLSRAALPTAGVIRGWGWG